MLTKCRVKKILDLIKKEYDYMDNKPIYVYINNHNWYTETAFTYYNLKLSKEFKDYDFTVFFYKYLFEEFNFDLTWAIADPVTTMEALAILHEIGHIQQTMNINVDEKYAEKMNRAYQDYRKKASHMNKQESSVAYRKISYEYAADKFAVDIFNKYAVKILAILNGTTQKEIKNRLAEFKKEVA